MAPPKREARETNGSWYRWEDAGQEAWAESQQEQVERMLCEEWSLEDMLQWSRERIKERPKRTDEHLQPVTPAKEKSATAKERNATAKEKSASSQKRSFSNRSGGDCAETPFVSRWNTRVMRDCAELQGALKECEVKSKTFSDAAFRSAQAERSFPFAVSERGLYPSCFPVKEWFPSSGPLPWGSPVHCVGCSEEGILDLPESDAGERACHAVSCQITRSCFFQHYRCDKHYQ